MSTITHFVTSKVQRTAPERNGTCDCNAPTLIGLPSLHGIEYVHLNEILFCKGESSQTSIYLANGKRHMVNRTLKQCNEMLEQFGFCRIHKSYIINLRHLKKYERNEGRRVELSDGSRFEVTRTFHDRLMDRLPRL